MSGYYGYPSRIYSEYDYSGYRPVSYNNSRYYGYNGYPPVSYNSRGYYGDGYGGDGYGGDGYGGDGYYYGDRYTRSTRPSLYWGGRKKTSKRRRKNANRTRKNGGGCSSSRPNAECDPSPIELNNNALGRIRAEMRRQRKKMYPQLYSENWQNAVENLSEETKDLLAKFRNGNSMRLPEDVRDLLSRYKITRLMKNLKKGRLVRQEG